MPAQDLWRHSGDVAQPTLGEADFSQIGVMVFAGVVAVFGELVAYTVFEVDGLTALELVNLVLFQILFGWIAYALASALVGFGISVSGGGTDPELQPLDPKGATGLPRGRTAILMPVHNEEPHGVFARLAAIDRSLQALAAEERFHLFVLSDTRDPDIGGAEKAAFERLRSTSGQADRIFYRRRAQNQGRKAGNIAAWVRTFGGAYDYMVVLDADSVMEGSAFLRLANWMDAEPRTALIQTVPKLVNRRSVFGRFQQFASRLYGPMLSDGLAHTSGVAGNYWGHNAIIRVSAFAAHAGLPHLAGPKPFGGEIMSHDFVEAALLRRAGWDVRLAPDLGGSYEECPPTLPDMIVRERRWCQGNLQHLPLVAARGLHWMSRVHLAQGVLTYLMPPLWLLFLFIGAGVSAEAMRDGPFKEDDYSLDMLKWVLAVSLLGLLVPRILALIRTLARPEERRVWGDPCKLVASVLCETVLSALIAPILMTAQTRALFDILAGRDSGWAVQRRADGSLAWKDAVRRYRPHTLFGAGLGVGAFAIAPGMLVWMAPVILGLLLSIPLSVWTADPLLGMRLKALGLFVTPEERAPPPILAGLTSPEPSPREVRWQEVLDRIFESAGEGKGEGLGLIAAHFDLAAAPEAVAT
jgi:membrane glycosyltransferase